MKRFRTTARALNRHEPYGPAALLFLLSLILFQLSRIPFPLNVDTFLYARAVETLEGPGIHFGYCLMGAFSQFFLAPLGVTSIQTLGLMSQFFGSISAAAMYVFTYLLSESRSHSFLAALILIFSGTFWIYSIHGEVYVPQLALVLLSLISLLKMKPFASSICLLTAVSITPTSLLALVPLLYILHMNRCDKKALIYFTVPILAAFVGLMALNGPNVIKSFADAVFLPTVFVEPFSYSKFFGLLTYRLTKTYVNSFNLICLFAALGFAFLYAKDKKQWGLMAAFLLPFVVYLFNIGLFSGSHLIITFIPVSFLGALGILRAIEWVSARHRTRLIAITLLVACHAAITYERSIRRQMTYADEFESVIHTLAEKYRPNGILLTDFDFGVIFFSMRDEHYPDALLKGNPVEFLKENSLTPEAAFEALKGKFWIQLGHLIEFANLPEFRAVVDERPIYVADVQFWPIGLIKLHVAAKEIFDIKIREEEPKRMENIREYLAHKLDVHVTLNKLIASPLYPVYLMQAVRQND